MAFPTYNPFGTPYSGNPFTEGADQFGAGGLWYSHGGRLTVQYQNPDFPNLTYSPSGGWVEVPGPTAIPQAQGTPVEPHYPVAVDEPRNPFVPVLDPAPTPTPAPSGDRIVDIPSEDSGPRGETKPALKKGKAQQSGSGSPWRLYALEEEQIYGG